MEECLSRGPWRNNWFTNITGGRQFCSTDGGTGPRARGNPDGKESPSASAMPVPSGSLCNDCPTGCESCRHELDGVSTDKDSQNETASPMAAEGVRCLKVCMLHGLETTLSKNGSNFLVVANCNMPRSGGTKGFVSSDDALSASIG